MKEAAGVLRGRLRDEDASIRFQAATALGRLGDIASVPSLLQSLDEKDYFARYAAFTALNRIGRADPAAWTAIARGLESDRPAIREGTIFAMRDTHEDVVVAALSSAVRKGSPELRAAAAEALGPLHHKDPEWKGEWWGSPYHPALSPRPARTVEWSGTQAVVAILREALDDADARVRRVAVDSLRESRDLSSAAILRERFSKETDPATKAAVLRMLGSLKDAGARDLVASVLADPSGEAELLQEAVSAAEQFGEADLLAKFVGARSPARKAAIAALAKMGGDAAVDAILPVVEEPDLETRKAALAALGAIRNRRAVPAFLSAFGREETRFEAAEALSRIPDARGVEAYLFGLSSANPALRDRSAKALGAVGKEALPAVEARVESLPFAAIPELQRIFAWAPKTSPIFRVDAKKADPAAYFEFALKNAGAAERGRILFLDPKGLACVKCHRIGTEGGDVGPDLSGIGAQFSRQELAESVVYPSRKIREGYQQTMVRLKDGRVTAGLVKGETPEELTLQDAEGARHAIRKSEIEQRKLSDVSLMPEGLAAGLSLQDFADLVSFLESLRQKPPDAPKK